MNKDNKLSQDTITLIKTEKHNTEQNIIKIISFIIGCVLGGLIGGYQIPAWGMPVGVSEFQEYEEQLNDAESFLKDNNVTVPTNIRNICEEYGLQHNIAPEVLMGIAWRESRFTPTIKSKTGCVGLMQISPSSHKRRIKKLKADLYDPRDSVAVASDYLDELLKSHSLTESLNLYNGNKSHNASEYTKDVLTVATALNMVGND